MQYDGEHLVRYIEGTLEPMDVRAIEYDLANDPELAERLDRLRAIQMAMKSSAARSFALGFGNRVLARLGDSREDAMYRSLAWLFRRAAIASLIVAVALGALNFVEYRDGNVSTTALELIFGQPSVSLGDALAIEAV